MSEDNKMMITCPKCNELIDSKEHLSQEFRSEVESQIRQQIVEEQSQRTKQAEEQLAIKERELRKQNEVAEFDKLRIQELELAAQEQDHRMELAKQKAKLDARKSALEEYQQMADDTAEQKSAELQIKVKELEDRLRQQKEIHEEALKRVEQGSVQSQGEGGELFIEDVLARAFPTDAIQEVPKGTKGADCLQSVVTVTGGVSAGTIVWESKRAKKWSAKWVNKVKEDTIRAKGDMSVIVSDALPSGISNMTMIEDGVWVCRFRDVEALAAALRIALIRTAHAVTRESGKEEKMEVLYRYLTSDKFSGIMRLIYDSFVTEMETIATEQRGMARNWKRRQEASEARLSAMTEMMGTLSSIATELPAISVLDQIDAAAALPPPAKSTAE
jgi:hypothetical protein